MQPHISYYYIIGTIQSEKFGQMIPHHYSIRQGPSIKYVRKMFRKTNISNPLIRTRTCAYQGVRNVSFSKHLRTYLMDDPLLGKQVEHCN